MTPAPTPEVPDEIVLTVPGAAHYARVARLAITGMAARAGFSYDEVEDLRIAIGEVCSILLAPTAEQLTFRCFVGERDLRVDAGRTPHGPEPEVSDLSRQILAAVVDDWSIDLDTRCVRVAKRHRG